MSPVGGMRDFKATAHKERMKAKRGNASAVIRTLEVQKQRRSSVNRFTDLYILFVSYFYLCPKDVASSSDDLDFLDIKSSTPHHIPQE